MAPKDVKKLMIRAVQMEGLWGELDQTNEFTETSSVQKC